MDEVLLLDDDPAMLSILEGILTGAGYIPFSTTDPNEALALVARRPAITVVVSDLLMPDVSGLDFVHRLNELKLDRATPRVLLLTAYPSMEAAIDALRLGARDFLTKPIRPAELIEAIERVMTYARDDQAAHSARPPEVDQLIHQAEELIGRLRRLAYAGDPPAPQTSEPAHANGQPPPDTSRAVPEQLAKGNGPVTARALVPPDPTPLSVLDIIEQLRRLRARYEHHKLDDVSWDLLLELLRAERLRQRISVSGLTISISGVSPTTSLRRVNELAARGYIARLPDPDDARRDFVSLTPKSNELLTEYLTQANGYLHDLAKSSSCH